jgi:hypothetical protein
MRRTLYQPPLCTSEALVGAGHSATLAMESTALTCSAGRDTICYGYFSLRPPEATDENDNEGFQLVLPCDDPQGTTD